MVHFEVDGQFQDFIDIVLVQGDVIGVKVLEEGAHVLWGGFRQLELVQVEEVEGVVEDPTGHGEDVPVDRDAGLFRAHDKVDVSEDVFAEEDLVPFD